ncbi:Transcriptional regulator MraZ [Candidatus Entotheonellaceae bacterium PAL068K]
MRRVHVPFCASFARVPASCHLDRQGRILIPPKLRQYAMIDSEALVIGILKKLEIWSPACWERYEAAESARFETRRRLMELRL